MTSIIARNVLAEVELELAEPSVWDDPARAQELGRERASLEGIVHAIEKLDSGTVDATDLLEMAAAEDDEDTVKEIESDIDGLLTVLEQLEFRRMFSGEMDPNNAFLDIQAGSGGDRSPGLGGDAVAHVPALGGSQGFQDRAGGMQRRRGGGRKERDDIYRGRIRLRLAAHRNRRPSTGAQIAFRLRQSPPHVFQRRVRIPEIDDNIDIEINPADVRTDTYRASGAGGQHVNKTDSAVRLTHEPSSIVVQCQSERSQHQNRDKAWKMLRAKLYEQEVMKRQEAAQATEDNKADIGWGSQIRSYVLDDSRVKDLRTSVETSNTQAVLDGSIDQFIEASLKSGL